MEYGSKHRGRTKRQPFERPYDGWPRQHRYCTRMQPFTMQTKIEYLHACTESRKRLSMADIIKLSVWWEDHLHYLAKMTPAMSTERSMFDT